MNERQAADWFGFTGQLVVGVRFATSTVTVVVQPHSAEIARRDTAGLGPVLDARLLEALATLPLGWPVPWRSLDPVTRSVLQAAPAGVLQRSAEHVVRRWRPAVAVTGVLRQTRDWRTGLRLVSVFAPDAPRGVLVTRPPRQLTTLLDEAGLLGIGVIISSGTGQDRLLVKPHRGLHSDPGPRHWRFLETVFAAWRPSQGASGAPPRHAATLKGQQVLPGCGL